MTSPTSRDRVGSLVLVLLLAGGLGLLAYGAGLIVRLVTGAMEADEQSRQQDQSAPHPSARLAPAGVPGSEGPTVLAWAKVAPEQIAEAERYGVPVAFENDLGMRFVLIPAGTFLMGSPEAEEAEGRHFDEFPPHDVTITKPFYMQITEVTNEHYRRFRPHHDSGVEHLSADETLSLDADQQPVVHVSWGDAHEFAVWLSGASRSRAYRLPTEAEWEYACRAGTGSRFWWGESDEDTHLRENVFVPTAEDVERARRGPVFARYQGKGMPAIPLVADGWRVSAPVGSYVSNAWGLHDMLGNVAEWCADWWAGGGWGLTPGRRASRTDPAGPSTGSVRVMRGCSWNIWGPRRVSWRRWAMPELATGVIGFRLVSPLSEPGEQGR